MGQQSAIEWTTHTFNPWRGCTKVSAGCANCYAETLSGRNPKALGVWGPKGTRVVASESMWRQPLKWNRDAEAAGVRARVFCASLADVFEGPETMPEEYRELVEDARARLFRLIDATPHLDWLLLTKRPENITKMMPPFVTQYILEAGEISYQEGIRKNLWLGTSVEDQAQAYERIPHLLRTPAAVRFLSCEPLLSDINLDLGRRIWCRHHARFEQTCCMDEAKPCFRWQALLGDMLDWVIIGGESGPRARPCDVAWIRSLIGQCKAAGVPCFVKQLGSRAISELAQLVPLHAAIRDRKGGEPDEWPADLRVREFPPVLS